MNNKETLQSYNANLASNNTMLSSILEVINNLPEAGSGDNNTIEPHVILEYMQCNGGTYFELDKKLNDNCRVELKLTRDINYDTIPFGNSTYDANTTNSYTIYLGPSGYYNGRTHINYGSDISRYYNNIDNEGVILVANKNVWSLYDFDGSTLFANTFVKTTFESDYNCTVGAGTWGTTLHQMHGKIYYFKLYDNDELIYDLIPVQKLDGTVTLFDSVSNTYLVNLGGAEPEAGPIVSGNSVSRELAVQKIKLINQEQLLQSVISKLETKLPYDEDANIVYLIKDGVDQTQRTGGHTYALLEGEANKGYSEASGFGYIELTAQQWTCVAWKTNNYFDFTKYTKIYVDFEFPTPSPDSTYLDQAQLKMCVFNDDDFANSPLIGQNLLNGKNNAVARNTQSENVSTTSTSNRCGLLVYNITESAGYMNYPVRIYNLWIEK